MSTLIVRAEVMSLAAWANAYYVTPQILDKVVALSKGKYVYDPGYENHVGLVLMASVESSKVVLTAKIAKSAVEEWAEYFIVAKFTGEWATLSKSMASRQTLTRITLQGFYLDTMCRFEDISPAVVLDEY